MTDHSTHQACDLPALVGSEKQIAWAVTIRAAHVSRMEAAFAEVCEKIKSATLPADVIAKGLAGAKHHRDRFVADTSASKWIDSRNRYIDYSGDLLHAAHVAATA